MIKHSLFSSFICLLFLQAIGIEAAIASLKQESADPTAPSAAPEMPATPAFQSQFLDYVFSQTYTMLLGTDRTPCAYRIDPTDVYEQGTTRFVTAAVTASALGSGCNGYLAFQVFQADCESNALYAIERETGDNGRFIDWERREWNLTIDSPRPGQGTSLDEIEQPPAEAICSLALSGN